VITLSRFQSDHIKQLQINLREVYKRERGGERFLFAKILQKERGREGERERGREGERERKNNLESSKAPCVSMRRTATSFPSGVFTLKISDQIKILLEKIVNQISPKLNRSYPVLI
jgi:hypothetical protein